MGLYCPKRFKVTCSTTRFKGFIGFKVQGLGFREVHGYLEGRGT